ncbi:MULTISPECIES: winged helix-turn-helix transcriptional regulator [Mycolicibacterium]|uniref:winged helix-turn-helix transcriptional regulator n=1 Tax=Mycolicibacterium TaxID=1866885 RepID=UPI00056D48A9|nr:helix-turn-helix domain-containing protein [Mycolicibacterium mageritense]MBN3452812.1 helix-turn-helix transcriptional regulator [Mycobacterium sp. DSM 3803]MCC9183351.1 helix-turn-helix transcriptional regulator [Mycolicibacterium mageritense]
MPKQSLGDIACSIARAADVVGQRWTPLILRDLFAGMARFEDIRRDLGIASNILAVRLDELERHGIVQRHQYQSTPPRHEYLLTDKGRDLYPVIATLLAWGDKWLAGADGPPALLVHTECGCVTTAKTVCAHCGGELDAATATATAGPGARPGPGTAVIGEFILGERRK